ncbi:MAG: hypothetical protein KF720_18100 [Rubrivivax sp.]|nr:hypothetical protein [Rubrivivax sp.]
MRYVAMQVLTWGTIAGAAGSALLLASLGGTGARPVINLSLADTTDVVVPELGRSLFVEPVADTAAPPSTAPSPGGEH